MEENAITSVRKKGTNYLPYILGAIGIGALIYFLTKPKANGGSLPSATADKSQYKLGYWQWSILRSKAQADILYEKTKVSGKNMLEELTQAAQLKLNDTVGADFTTFCTAVDDQLLKMPIGNTLQSAIAFVVNEQMRLYIMARTRAINETTLEEKTGYIK